MGCIIKKNRRGYVCGSYNKHGIKACADHHVIEEDLISDILGDIEKLLAVAKEQNLLSKMERKIKKQLEQQQKELQSINRQIKELEKQKINFIQLLASEVITQEEYRDVVKQNEINMYDLLQTKSKIESNLSNQDSNEQMQLIQKELSKIKKVDTLTPDLLHHLIEKIEIKADGTARIFYRFSLPSAII